jgi:ankyrin repeat protein
MQPASQHALPVIAGLLIWALPACDGIHADDIHDAVRLNDLEGVKAIVRNDPDAVNRRAARRETPLHEAVQRGDPEMVTFLIAEGADVNARCDNDFTPLHFAEDAEIVRILLGNGADPKLRASGRTALDEAVRGENVEVIDTLLAAGEVLTFEHLVQLGRTDDVASMLRERPWLAKARRKCLHMAAQKGHLEIARLLLDYGADPNLDYGFANISGTFSPLSSAIVAGQYEIAKLFCERGANTNVSGGKYYDNLFHESVATRETRFVQLMLEHGADVNSQSDRWQMAPLHVAADIGDAEKCELLIRYKGDVNARTPDGAPPLMFAAASGHYEVCDLLLSKGAEFDIHVATALGQAAWVRRSLEGNSSLANDRDKRLHRTPLFWAAERGNLEVLELLIQYKADVNARALPFTHSGRVVTGPRVWNAGSENGNNDAGETPLHLAAGAGHAAIVRALLKEGARIDATDTRGDTPLRRAVRNGRVETVKLLLQEGAPIEGETGSVLPDAYNNTEITDLLLSQGSSTAALDEALRRAAGKSAKVVERLLAQGARADIYTACILGQTDQVAKLLEDDRSLVDSPQADNSRIRPLILAAKHGHTEIVDLLLDKGAEVESKMDASALHAAAASGQAKVITLLLSRGVDINRKDSTGRTPLHSGASAGHQDVVTLLIARGAQVLATDVHRETALHAAALHGHTAIARTLIDAGISADCRNQLRETPLHKAAHAGHAEMASVLLNAGADVNARDRRARTPLYHAEGKLDDSIGRKELDRNVVARVLREHGGVK